METILPEGMNPVAIMTAGLVWLAGTLFVVFW
jgi:hypothetical protein